MSEDYSYDEIGEIPPLLFTQLEEKLRLPKSKHFITIVQTPDSIPIDRFYKKFLEFKGD